MILLFILLTSILVFSLLVYNNIDLSVNETLENNVKSTPVCEGSWSPWTETSPCDATCETPQGNKQMTRTFTVPPSSSDIWCPGVSNGETQNKNDNCTIDDCPCEGSWSPWTETSPCDATCAIPDGNKQVTRTFTVPPSSSDIWCPGFPTVKHKIRMTIAQLTTVREGSWSPWTETSPCDATCAIPDGNKQVIRTFTVPPSSSDIWCPGVSNGETQNKNDNCTLDDCPCEGSWSPWTEISPCDATCAIPDGNKQMTRTFTVPPSSSDIWCPGVSNGETQNKNDNCTLDDCPCEGSWSPWTETSPCDATCATPQGNKQMTRTFTVPPSSSDIWCPGVSEGDNETQPQACRVEPFKCSTYLPYRLDADMGTGIMIHIGNNRESQDVTKAECAQTCFDSTWCKSFVYCDNFPGKNADRIYGPQGLNRVGPCLHFDKSKEHFQYLGFAITPIEFANMTFKEREDILEMNYPNIDACGLWEITKPGNDANIDCEGQWVPVGDCNQPCDGTQTLNSGTQLYRYEITQWKENYGQSCDNTRGAENQESCHVCPIHCEGEWTPEWTECTETCGGGTQSKTYTVITPADYGEIHVQTLRVIYGHKNAISNYVAILLYII